MVAASILDSLRPVRPRCQAETCQRAWNREVPANPRGKRMPWGGVHNNIPPGAAPRHGLIQALAFMERVDGHPKQFPDCS